MKNRNLGAQNSGNFLTSLDSQTCLDYSALALVIHKVVNISFNSVKTQKICYTSLG